MTEETCIICAEETGERLDKILAKRFEDRYSRTYFQRLIDHELVLLNGTAVKKRTKLALGDEIEVHFAASAESALSPECVPLHVLFEDEHLLLVNKPAGMVVHPAPGNWSGTFVNALLYHCRHQLQFEGADPIRPGIVHRLDKDTSGLLLAAKTTFAQQKLIAQFANRHIQKEYLAICLGNPGSGSIEAPIGRHPVHRQRMAVLEGEEGKGRPALTHFRSLGCDAKLSAVQVKIVTGRTHQIRVHMQHHGTPVLGDAVYGNASANQKYGVKRQLLHAYSLAFTHPVTSQFLTFQAPIPDDMAHFMRILKADIEQVR